MLPEKIAKRTYVLFQPKVCQIATVTRKRRRLRHDGGRTVFVRVAKDEFARFNGRARTGRCFDVDSFDRRLRESIAVTKVFVSVFERWYSLQVQGGEHLYTGAPRDKPLVHVPASFALRDITSE